MFAGASVVHNRIILFIAQVELPGDSKLCNFIELLRFMYTGSCSISSVNCIALLQLSNYYAARAWAHPRIVNQA